MMTPEIVFARSTGLVYRRQGQWGHYGCSDGRSFASYEAVLRDVEEDRKNHQGELQPFWQPMFAIPRTEVFVPPEAQPILGPEPHVRFFPVSWDTPELVSGWAQGETGKRVPFRWWVTRYRSVVERSDTTL